MIFFRTSATALLASILLIDRPLLARTNDEMDPSTQPSADVAGLVSDLVSQLGAEEWTSRDAASARLVEYGPKIVEQLQRALGEANDPEVRSRLETAIAQINENDLVGASVISMNFVDAPIADVIASLNEQARCNIAVNVPEPATSRKLTVQLDRASFWQAIDAIERASGLNFSLQQRTWTFGRQGRAFPNGIACESGPLQFVVTEYHLSASYADGGFNAGKSNLTVFVRGEPKLRLAQQKTRLIIEKAVDELGHNLIDTRDTSGIWLNESAVGNANIQLARPHDIGTRIVELTGYVELSLATRVEAIRIDNLADFEGIERSAGTMKVRIEPASETERANLQAGWQSVRIRVIDNISPELLQQRLNSAVNMARVFDERGRPAILTQTQYSNGDVPNEFCCLATFQPGGESNGAFSLRLDIPLEYRQVTTPFTFKDLGLP